MDNSEGPISILEAAQQYDGWCRCNTRPEHAARMRLYWAEILRHKVNMGISALQDTITELDGENNAED